MPVASGSSSASCAKMQTTLSTWTPLNHPQTNSKVFAERRNLLAKWFDRWSDGQRRAVLQDFVQRCSREQLVFLSLGVSRRLPLQAADFTCTLPRALCLYLFSFLDPRSLCRCARVSWHWRSIVELDQLWRPKCLRLGWCIGFSPTPFEQGVWKRHYIQTVEELRLSSLQRQIVDPHVSAISSGQEDRPEAAFLGEERPASSRKKKPSTTPSPWTPPPWRDADRRPKDTLRFNYLDNVDDQAVRGRMSRASTCLSDTRKSDGGGGRKSLSEANYKLRKAKSLMFLSSNCRPPPPPPPPPHHHHQTQARPPWAAPGFDHPVAMDTTQARRDAGVRPGPAWSAVPRLSVEALRASRRSQRSAPATPLFEPPPLWTAPASRT